MRIIAADDQPDVLEALRLLLKREGIAMVPATSPAGVLSALEAEDFDVALLDLNYARDTTSGAEGLDLISKIRGLDSNLPIIVMTAWGSVEGAVEAMRRGARDYVQKPWDNARLVTTIRTQIELGKALKRTRRLEDENALVTGEHGTGKEVIARYIHATSKRSSRALVTMNAGGVAEGVFESELF